MIKDNLECTISKERQSNRFFTQDRTTGITWEHNSIKEHELEFLAMCSGHSICLIRAVHFEELSTSEHKILNAAYTSSNLFSAVSGYLGKINNCSLYTDAFCETADQYPHSTEILFVVSDNQSMHNPTEQNIMKLTPKNVETIFLNCLFTAEEVDELDIATDASKYIEAKGVITHVGFHPQRLKDSEKAVCEMLGELSMFFHTRFGGSSFLNMCEDKDGKQWTGMHKIMDQLVCLGVGLNIITVIRQEDGSSVVGSVPIISINLEDN